MPAKLAIGVSAHLGWAATAILRVRSGLPQVLHTERIETAVATDRESQEPYHVAGGFEGLSRVPVPANPEAVLSRGLGKQQRCAARSLEALLSGIAGGGRFAFAGILVSRGRKAPSFAKAVGSHVQIHIEEGIAVRASIAQALTALGARVHEIDQKTALSMASAELHRSEKALMAELDALRPASGGAWRKEEKLAAVVAWLAATRGAG